MATDSASRPAVEVTAAGGEDLDALLVIERACFATSWSREQFERDLLHNPAAYYSVARWGGEAVGHAGMYLLEEEAHIITIAVLPQQRRRGIAMRLMLHLIEQALARGVSRMTLEVRLSNHAARALYERLGFYAVAVRRGYYHDTGEDALIMWVPQLDAPWLQARWHRERERLASVDSAEQP